MSNTERMNVRFVKIKDTVYLHAEDIVELLRELAATEETDTRKRIEELACRLVK
jgi:hypothetical protein